MRDKVRKKYKNGSSIFRRLKFKMTTIIIFIPGSRESTVSSNLRVQKSISQPSCPKEFTGLIPNYTDCSKFINCNNGQSFPMDCPPGTLFDANKNICDFPYNALCFDGQSGQVVHENLSGQKGQAWQGGQSGTQHGYWYQGSGSHALGQSESTHQAGGVHSGAISGGDILGYRGSQYGGSSGTYSQIINSNLDFGQENSGCKTEDCTR